MYTFKGKGLPVIYRDDNSEISVENPLEKDEKHLDEERKDEESMCIFQKKSRTSKSCVNLSQ